MLDIILNQIRVLSYTHSKEFQLRKHTAFCLLDETVEVDLDSAESLERTIDDIKSYYDDKLTILQSTHSEAFQVDSLLPTLKFRNLLISRLIELDPGKISKYVLELNEIGYSRGDHYYKPI